MRARAVTSATDGYFSTNERNWLRASANRPRVNSLCAASNAFRAAASSYVGRGGGTAGLTGATITADRRLSVARGLGRFARAILRAGLDAFVVFGDAFFGIAFCVRDAPRGFCLALCALVALRARAFPGGERLVAGFRRVDFPAVTRLREGDDTDEWRALDFFKLFATELLISEPSHIAAKSCRKSRQKSMRAYHTRRRNSRKE